MLEVLNHLDDEERDDFPRRLALLLEDPDQTWPPIAPEGWVVERAYTQRNLETSLEDFTRERVASLRWLRSLAPPSWDSQHEHPGIGRIRAGDLLASWIAHDFLHIRQISTLWVGYISATVEPFSIRYATS